MHTSASVYNAMNKRCAFRSGSGCSKQTPTQKLVKRPKRKDYCIRNSTSSFSENMDFKLIAVQEEYRCAICTAVISNLLLSINLIGSDLYLVSPRGG